MTKITRWTRPPIRRLNLDTLAEYCFGVRKVYFCNEYGMDDEITYCPKTCGYAEKRKIETERKIKGIMNKL